MTEEKLGLTVAILTGQPEGSGAHRLRELIIAGIIWMKRLTGEPMISAIVPTENMRKALASGGDGVIELLLQGSKKCFLLATDEESEKLLDELEVEMDIQDVTNSQLVIYRKTDAIVAHCERRKMRSLPETADQLSIYAVEAARMVGEYLRSQIDI